MNESDAFKMIEELLRKEINKFQIENDQYLISNNYNNDQAIYLTPPVSQDNLLHVDDYPKKPNRPYSYYIATNFHPLDLTIINEKAINDDHDLDLNETQQVVIDEKKVKIRTKKKANNSRANKSKRLSASLGDIIASNANNEIDVLSNSINTTQNTPVTRKKLSKDFELCDEFTNETNNNFFTNRRHLTNFFSNNLSKNKTKSNQYYSSTKRLNKFIRGIFRLDEDEHFNQDTIIKENNENSKFKSKFTRFFSSFRSTTTTNNNNTSDSMVIVAKQRIKKKPDQLIVMDDRPSSKLLMLPEIKLCIPESPPNNQVTNRNELNYSEIENCLRKLTTSSYIELSSKTDSTGYVSGCIDSSSKSDSASTPLSSPQSTMSSSMGSFSHMKSSCCLDNFDIPFIDDDADSNYELNLKETVTNNNNNNNNNNTQSVLTSVSTTSYENNSLLNLITDLVIQNYLKSISYEKLDSIMQDFCQNEWLNIVLIFDMTNRAIKMLDEKTNQSTIVKLKEICTKYINDKYYDFICQNGGLVNNHT
jgi:hypothetical protein